MHACSIQLYQLIIQSRYYEYTMKLQNSGGNLTLAIFWLWSTIWSASLARPSVANLKQLQGLLLSYVYSDQVD